MGEDHAFEVKIKTVLNASGNRAEEHGEPDTKDEFQLSGRDAARFSLQSVALTVTPATALANLAMPVTLYDRAAPPEESNKGLDEALATLSPAARKTVTEAIAKLQAHFDHPAFQPDAFDLQLISNEEGFRLGFDRPLPSLDTHVLKLRFADAAHQEVVVTVTHEAQGTGADDDTENTGTTENNQAMADTAVMIAGEVALILENAEDEFDFTQLDIY